ncbi:transposable element Tc1 transposase [Trichonephila clavipes]|nr:transposable element Tc1 transposase [Trichonephila clavipes]
MVKPVETPSCWTSKEEGHQKLSRLVKQNRLQAVAQLTAQYIAGPTASVSDHIVQWTLVEMGLSSKSRTREPLLTKLH